MPRRRHRHHETVEMQMGPMIDMVFLLLVFFMVTSKPIRPETELSMTLPGAVAQEEAVDVPDEQRIVVAADGMVYLNELAYDTPTSRTMPQLTAILLRFKEAARLAKSEPLITIALDNRAEHQRLVDVLGACGQAKLTMVTFAEQEGGSDE